VRLPYASVGEGRDETRRRRWFGAGGLPNALRYRTARLAVPPTPVESATVRRSPLAVGVVGLVVTRPRLLGGG